MRSTETPAPVAIPAVASAARATAGGAPWHRETEAGFLSSIDIPAFGAAAASGASAGGILIVYTAGGNVTQVRAMGAELALAAIAVMLAAAAFSAFLLRLGLGRRIRLFQTTDAAIAAFERGSWRSAATTAQGVDNHLQNADEPAETVGSEDGEDIAADLPTTLEAAEARYRATDRQLAEPRESAS